MVGFIFGLDFLSWGSLEYAYLFPVFLFLAACLVYRLRKTYRAVAALSGSWASILMSNFSSARAISKIILCMIGLLFLGIALLSPQGAAHEDNVLQEGRDVYIALDISRSMLASDMAPTRLDCAKKKIKQLLALLTCERAGLILFSGSAFVQCPLTRDMGAFTMFLDTVDAETISSGSTAFDSAIKKALEAFENMPHKKNKLLVIVTDGEDFSTNLAAVKERAIAQGLHIFTLGIGSVQGAPVPAFDAYGNVSGHQRDSKGAIVISRLNESLLKSLAHDVGGEYIQSTRDDTDIKKLVYKVQLFEKESFGAQKVKRVDEKYPYFVLVSFICFLLDWVL